MEENYILLKFISSADKSNKKKYLKDFLNGSLYMNTLNYFGMNIISSWLRKEDMLRQMGFHFRIRLICRNIFYLKDRRIYLKELYVI